MKHLVGKTQKAVKVPFMEGETVEVKKLTVAQVKTFQAKLNESKDKEDEDSGLKIQREVIRMAVVGAEELTDDELDAFPLDDLSKLVQKILELAGVKSQEEGNVSAKKS
jgi:hypothetical protein